jgi:hypothetical protein
MKAFPNMTGEKGMDLRDYFAAAAMQGYMSTYKGSDAIDPSIPHIVGWAYDIADAMMKAREHDTDK